MIKDNNKVITDNGKILSNLGIFAIDGLLIWYDPNLLLGFLNDDDLIQNFPDRVGGIGLRQNTVSAQPKFKTNRINGNPTMVLEPTKVISTRAGSIASFINGRVIELFTVVRINWLSPPSNFIQIQHVRTIDNFTVISQRINSFPRYSLNTVDDLSVGSQITLTSSPIPLNSTYIYYMKIDITSIGSITRAIEVIDTIPVVETTIAGNLTFTTNHTLRVGGAGNDREIEIGDNIIFSRTTPLNTSEKQVIISYLKSKYAI